MLLPEREPVHTPVHVSGLLLLGLRVADGQADAADGGVADPVQSPPHRNGAGCHVGNLKALDGAGSWGQWVSSLCGPSSPLEGGARAGDGAQEGPWGPVQTGLEMPVQPGLAEGAPQSSRDQGQVDMPWTTASGRGRCRGAAAGSALRGLGLPGGRVGPSWLPGWLVALTVTLCTIWGLLGPAREKPGEASLTPGKGTNPWLRELRGCPSSQSAEPWSAGSGASPLPRWHGGGCLPSRAHLEQSQKCFLLKPGSGWPCLSPAPEALVSHAAATLLAPCAVPPPEASSLLTLGHQRPGCRHPRRMPAAFLPRDPRRGSPLPPGPSSSCSPGRQAMPASLALLP